MVAFPNIGRSGDHQIVQLRPVSATPSPAAAFFRSASSVARGKPSRCANSRYAASYTDNRWVRASRRTAPSSGVRSIRIRSRERLSRKAAVSDSAAPPAFVHYQDVSHLEPPQAGYDSLFGAHLMESQTSIGVVFILKGPARRDGCIGHQGHQDLRPSSRQRPDTPDLL